VDLWLSMKIDYKQLSKAVSHALRHESWLYELELDDFGWVSVDSLLSAIRSQRSEWRNLNLEDLNEMIRASDKKRHEISGDQIRALYGHSVPGKLNKLRADPPEILYHGTTHSNIEQIMRKGLLPMGRQYVHLSIDIEMANKVGKRKDKDPVILKIFAKRAYSMGINFYIGNDAVWLADLVPPEFIEK
jgi:putative RNA 2'-phosphotransferase